MLRYLYTCIESAEIISALTSLAKDEATSLFPDAVGPSRTIINFRIFQWPGGVPPFREDSYDSGVLAKAR